MEADEEGALGRPQVQRAQLIDIKAAELKVGFSKPPVIGCLSDRNFVPAIANLGFARIATGCRDPIARTSDASKPARPDDGNLVFADRDRRDVPRAARQALSALQRSYTLNPGLPWSIFTAAAFGLCGNTASAKASLAEAQRLSADLTSISRYGLISQMTDATAQALREKSIVRGFQLAGLPD